MKKIKLLTILALSIIMALNTFAIVSAEENQYVYVTISAGDIKLAAEKITLTDADSDGTLTINDALYLAHEAKYTGGAEAGFASSIGAYGLKIDKLWGYEKGDSYGYYVNNTSALSLGDTVKNGDYIYAFVYQDLEMWSDTYSFFETTEKTVISNEEISLKLSYSGYDEMWNIITNPVNNATITINGTETEYKTDENGEVTFSINEKGSYVISAKSENQNLVPAVCNIVVKSASSEESKDNSSEDIETESPSDNGISVYMVIMAISVAFVIIIKNRKKYEA